MAAGRRRQFDDHISSFPPPFCPPESGDHISNVSMSLDQTVLMQYGPVRWPVRDTVHVHLPVKKTAENMD